MFIKDWTKADIRFGLVYPNLYKIGTSSYSMRLLYFLLNSYENIVCERIFLPEKIMFPASKDLLPIDSIYSLENGIHPKDFDILGFSLQFENDFKNILWILEKADIPLKVLERRNPAMKYSTSSNMKHFPLVIGGGPVATSNPIPFCKFFDLFFIGDAEPSLEPFLTRFLSFKQESISFEEFMLTVSKIKGIYVPSLKNEVRRAVLKNLDDSLVPIIQPSVSELAENMIFLDKFLLEINRGCPYSCKFCISSHHNHPFRNRNYENIIKAIKQASAYLTFKTIGFIGSCVSAHPRFVDICQFILEIGKKFTIPSIRIDHLTDSLIDIFEKSELKTITIAPETATNSLRFGLNKKITNEQFFSALEKIKKSKIKNIKFYFLVGLPHETSKDIETMVEFVKEIAQMGFDKNSLRINVNPFVPKLNTPYEKATDFYISENLDFLLKKLNFIEKELKGVRSVKLKFSSSKNLIKEAKLQTMISMGNEDIGDILTGYYSAGANFGSLRRELNDRTFSLDEYYDKIKSCYSPWKLNV
ncbi:MAG: radical SAM protein [Candidatus Lokiarchaeota archaeon]|nr:radical SAM protein [Candidatus Lokiarchaeota archaeon]MBD3342210.1 radical SAM protein [Candidatus Lokiarchaeota archaeon]